jgi:addiction module HigA family antidote
MPMKKPVHPGAIVNHAIEASGLNVTDAADRLQVVRQTLSRLINEKTGVSPEMAIRLSKAFGSTPEHWLKMQMAYDLAQMEKKSTSIKVKRFPQVDPLPV